LFVAKSTNQGRVDVECASLLCSRDKSGLEGLLQLL